MRLFMYRLVIESLVIVVCLILYFYVDFYQAVDESHSGYKNFETHVSISTLTKFKHWPLWNQILECITGLELNFLSLRNQLYN